MSGLRVNDWGKGKRVRVEGDILGYERQEFGSGDVKGQVDGGEVTLLFGVIVRTDHPASIHQYNTIQCNATQRNTIQYNTCRPLAGTR